MASLESIEGKTAINPSNGIVGDGETTAARRVEHHADAILRAAGSGLRHYSMDGTRRAILFAVLDCYEEAYRAGADRVLASYRAGEVGK